MKNQSVLSECYFTISEPCFESVFFFPHDKKGSVTFNVTFEVFALLFPTSTEVCVNLLYSSGLFLIDSQHSCNKITIFKYPAIIDLAFSQMLVVRDQNSVSVNGIG